ncbi:putative late blight resistance protein homolog R1A-10 isoform X2 [Salvia splendens]|uniref:putative late blight resistance protein homolog R1A-10 isoform X2 n=1 Tax=Salvia splendens TaxID=180675 RepID=UPI001C27B3CC|nr:putative late blight resistance protein homolog R1A-10 isoform X2 [Salvia splendens]
MAYAVVISLKQTLELLLDSTRSKLQISSSKLQPIYEDLCYLKSFFDKINSLEDSNSVEELERDIKDVLQNTRDLIESHLSDLIHAAGVGSSTSGFSQKLVEVKVELSPFIDTLKAKENKLTGNQQLHTDVDVDVPVSVSSIIDHEIVGLEDEVEMLRQRLLDPDSGLKVICIVGMAGIGKTTLAKEVCKDTYIEDKFELRLVVTIGEDYQLKELLLAILSQVLKASEVKKEETVHELGNRLKASLSRRTYLVVLDDLWDMGAWNQLHPYFPDEGNGSRIVFTTRMTNVDRVVHRKYIFQKRLLSDQESWELFCKTAFSDKCPSELEEIGKTIARNMGGLPLALVEIGKHVSKCPTTVDCWMEAVLNMNSLIRKTTIPKVVNAELPHHLKACLFYLGLFHPNHDIPTSQLIKLWVAEGFIDPEADQNLEQIAEEYLEELVSRGLVMVHERSYTGRIKTCGMIHKLVRDICVTQSQQQKIFHIVNKGSTTTNQRRLSIQSDVLLGGMAVSRVRSLVFMCAEHQDPFLVFEGVRWLRVLHALPIRFREFPREVLKLVRLRYLAITFEGELPSSISRLLNLEVLIIFSRQAICSPVFLPLEIWKLEKLRHLHCMGFDLPVPSTEHGDDLYFTNLLTLSGLIQHSTVLKYPVLLLSLAISISLIHSNAQSRTHQELHFPLKVSLLVLKS